MDAKEELLGIITKWSTDRTLEYFSFMAQAILDAGFVRLDEFTIMNILRGHYCLYEPRRNDDCSKCELNMSCVNRPVAKAIVSAKEILRVKEVKK